MRTRTCGVFVTNKGLEENDESHDHEGNHEETDAGRDSTRVNQVDRVSAAQSLRDANSIILQ